MAIRMELLVGAAVLALGAGALPASAQTTTPAKAPAATDAAPSTQPTAAGGLSPGQLAMMERASDPRLSPDGRRVLYNLRTTDWAGNRGVGALWVIEADGTSRRLAASDGGAASGRWAPDGNSVYFLSSRGGSNQVWRADREGMAAAQVTTLPIDVSGFRVADDGRSLILAVAVFTDCATLQCVKDRLAERAKSGRRRRRGSPRRRSAGSSPAPPPCPRGRRARPGSIRRATT